MNGNLVFGNGGVSVSRGNYEVTEFDLGLRLSGYQRFTFINNEADRDYEHASVIFAGYDASNHARYAFSRYGEISSDVTFDGKVLGRYKIPSLIATGWSGQNWYRKWSDGWLEQGGNYGSSSQSTVSFLRPYKDNGYTVLLTTCRSTGNTGSEWVKTKTTTNFTRMFSYGDESSAGQWYTCGTGA